MKRLNGFRMMLLIAVSIFSFGYLPAVADAVPIVYQFSSTAASGGLTADFEGNTPIADFQSVSFSISIFGDTANVNVDPFNPNSFAISGLTGTMSIGGYSGNFADPLTVWVDNSGETVGFDNDVLGQSLLALYVLNGGLATYDLRSTFGPITAGAIGVPPVDIPGTTVFASENFAAIQMSFGYLSLDTVDNASFAAVPEPATMLLLGTGLLGLVGFRRKLKK